MCYDSKAQPPVPPGGAGATTSEDTVLTAADGNRFAAFLATPARPNGAGVLIYPDVRGLHQFYKDLAVRFAEQGATALAIDYFGRTAGLTARDDAFQFRPHVEQMRWETFMADVRAGVARLEQAGAPAGRTVTVGFCMGGTLSFMTGTEDVGLAGLVGFYSGMSRNLGPGTLLDLAGQIKYPSLGLFGGDDPGIPQAQVDAFDAALDRAGVEHEVVVDPGAPHSFFDRRWTDFADASADAWRRVLAFIAARAQPVTV